MTSKTPAPTNSPTASLLFHRVAKSCGAAVYHITMQSLEPHSNYNTQLPSVPQVFPLHGKGKQGLLNELSHRSRANTVETSANKARFSARLERDVLINFSVFCSHELSPFSFPLLSFPSLFPFPLLPPSLSFFLSPPFSLLPSLPPSLPPHATTTENAGHATLEGRRMRVQEGSEAPQRAERERARERKKERERERKRKKERDKDRERESERKKKIEREREKEREREREMERDGERWREMESDGERCRWREMESDGERWKAMERDGDGEMEWRDGDGEMEIGRLVEVDSCSYLGFKY
ncbi:hypothetical protein FHG87_022586 [Trinorchestia longiramus]|nr:hypothetical protein FHG87_022586 [Trinorchestia longiramus]